jgi:hypothetical protein
VLRIERDRQGAVRIFAGPKLTLPPPPSIEVEQVVELPIVEAESVAEVVEAAVVEPAAKTPRRRKTAKPKTDAGGTKPKRPRIRARKTVPTKDVAAAVGE